MWSCQGKALNINRALLGKVTFEKHGIFSRHKYLYVCEGFPRRNLFYAGVLTNQERDFENGKRKLPCVFGINKSDLFHLKEGDIVLIEPTGMVNVVWEVDSPHNVIMVTEDCNCNCLMCPQPPRRDQECRKEINLQLIDLIDRGRNNQIGISGGEPTLVGEDLFKLIAVCKKKLPKASLLLLSNGRMFKNLDFSKKLAEIDHPDVTVCVALYADTDREHDRIVGVNGSFYETIKGLENLALLRQKIEIRNVMQSQNYKRLPQFAELIYQNFPFVFHIAFMGLEITGLALKNVNKVWIDPIEYMTELNTAVKFLHRREMNVSIYNLQLCILPPELWKFSRKSISLWKNIYLIECEQCDYKEECSGFFGTSGGWYSNHIRMLKKIDNRGILR
ncbi:MAG TPA: His-Xaa-Ser system radical SAM maturase HxsC [Candidatus Atribacteria bacterium]|nr:His-Xaa-Ser system radical SAM maturase HxsC [Candidatus Atribacteria bacterium]